MISQQYNFIRVSNLLLKTKSTFLTNTFYIHFGFIFIEHTNLIKEWSKSSSSINYEELWECYDGICND